jgi:hypothetical protein
MSNMRDTKSGGINAAPGTEGGDPAALKDAAPGDKGQGEGGDQVPTSWEDFFKHPRFRELTEERRALKDQLTQFENERKAAAEKAEAEEEKRLAEGNQFKELADKNAAKLETTRAQLKDALAQVEKFQAMAAAEVEAQLKALPEPIAKLLTPLMQGRTAVDQLEILRAQAETIAALMPPTGSDNLKLPRGVPPTPPGEAPEKVKAAQEESYRKGYRAQLKQGL